MKEPGNRLLHPILEACDLLGGMSRSTFYAKVKAGDIEVVKVGRSTYVAHEELKRYVRTLAGSESAA